MSVKKKSMKQEKRIAKNLNEIKEQARQSINSGSLWFDKSDIVSKLFRIEAKTKIKPSASITIKKEWLEKVEEEAFLTAKVPTLAFSFGNNRDYFILRDRDFYDIVERLNRLEGGDNDSINDRV